MSHTTAQEIQLVPLDLPNLRHLAAVEPLDFPVLLADGALPPADVASRVLKQLENGIPAFWCVPLLIIEPASGKILGGCGFKGLPINGSVEIGYGVASSERSRGIATAAVGELLKLALTTGIVQQVVALIVPDNLASSSVVAKLGFTRGHSLVDSDGEWVVQWVREIAV